LATRFPVLLSRDIYPGSQIQIFFIPDPGSKFFSSRIPDPGFEFFPSPDPGYRIGIKEFKYFNPKKGFLSSQKYDPGFPSRIRIQDPNPDFLSIADPNPGSRITNPRVNMAQDL
jgi:hypothetical protein